MLIFIRSLVLCFTVWVLTALLNTALAGTWLCLFANEYNQFSGTYMMVLIFTLIFSVPGMFFFWIILLATWDNENLFRTLLKAGMVISSLSTMILFVLPHGLARHEIIPLSACIIIAAVASIMIHHFWIKSISTNKKTEHYA